MDPLITFGILALISATYIICLRLARRSLSHIPGPRSESFLLGNLPQLFQSQAAEADFQWKARYGGVIRYKGLFGAEHLMISDPKALNYLLHQSGYLLGKPKDALEILRLTAGEGLIYADGARHQKQRYVLTPGFGMPEARACLPIFSGVAAKITSKWNDAISSTADGTAVINVCRDLARATLDAIGAAAFDYEFGAMDNSQNELARAYQDFFVDLVGGTSKNQLFVMKLMSLLPARLLRYFLENSKSKPLVRAQDQARITDGVAKKLIEEKTRAALEGGGKDDIMSILVRSNAGQSSRGKLDDVELISQMRTIMTAGHETTANTMDWALYELARNPEIQKKLRNEIWEYEKFVQSRGTEWTAQDFESMPYLVAFVKEIFRFDPIVYHLERQASQDAVVPLSAPITSTTGSVLDEILIPKDTKVTISIAAYNRDHSVWGPDAHIFNPERWMGASEKKEYPVGVYGNLLTFAGGLRSCIGWRFAVLEMHAFIVELVGNFEFKLTSNLAHIRRESCGVMISTVEGEHGQQLPLAVSVASRE